MNFLGLLGILISFNAFATDACKKISEYRLRIEAHTSNLKNASSSSYKYQSVSCQLTCKINETAFLKIDMEEEKALISQHSVALLTLDESCSEQSGEITSMPSSLISL